jgi:hypothetical protein
MIKSGKTDGYFDIKVTGKGSSKIEKVWLVTGNNREAPTGYISGQ